jgi:periplasmic copper chaperone A
MAIAVAVAALAAAPVATAHVTMNPGEWEAGGFARFAVRVPNERPNASTTEVTMQFPENVISASFQDVPGWTRRIQMAQLDEPIEEEGEEPISERIASVTWTGGEVERGEFVEFGVSFQVPEDAPAGEALLFPTIQTYSNGEVVRWIAPEEEADEPAPRVTVLAAAEEEGGAAAATTTEEEEGGEAAEAAPAAASGDDDDDGSGLATVALILGIAGLAAGLAALGLTVTRPRRA